MTITDATGTIDFGSNGIGTTAVTSVEEWDLSLPDGRDLPQRVDSHAYSGRTVVRANSGPDTVLGGAGSDFVDGGSGADVIDPGAGTDTVWGGRNTEPITVRDGAATSSRTAGQASTRWSPIDPTSCPTARTSTLPAPETDKIAGPKKVTKGQKAAFTFGSPAAGSTFECQLDKGAFKACVSPLRSTSPEKPRPGSTR